MNRRQKNLEILKHHYCTSLCEDSTDRTEFDNDVIDAIRKLQRQYANSPAKDYQMTTEEKELGFVIKEGSGILGCCTIPCFGGKMPYQSEPTVGCAIGRTMCDQSPIQCMREVRKCEQLNAELKEQKRLVKNKRR